MNTTASLSGTRKVPRLPLALAVTGLAPFAAGAVLPWLGPSIWPMAIAIYAACVLSFLGGVQWGALLAHDGPPDGDVNVAYLLSIVPPLFAWMALLLGGAPTLTFMLLAAGFLSAWAVDGWMRARALTPAWYLRLRHPLTAGVVLCLVSLGIRVTLYGA